MRSNRYAARVAGFRFLFLIATVGAVSALFGGLEEDEIRLILVVGVPLQTAT